MNIADLDLIFTENKGGVVEFDNGITVKLAGLHASNPNLNPGRQFYHANFSVFKNNNLFTTLVFCNTIPIIISQLKERVSDIFIVMNKYGEINDDA